MVESNVSNFETHTLVGLCHHLFNGHSINFISTGIERNEGNICLGWIHHRR